MKTKIEELVICKNFKLIKKLGTGAFGQIYLVQNKNKQTQQYAAKLEETNSKFPQLHFQAKMYKYLSSHGESPGFPKVHALTTQGQYNIMIMDLLGPSLQDLFVKCNKVLSLRTVLQIGQQIINRIEYMHQKQVIHRDIKPDNFLMGIEKNSHIVYAIDLGLSKKYIRQGKHIPYKQGKQLTGTARYASINTHLGVQQSRRDDIQSIGYNLMYFLRGILPWQNMKANDTKTKYKMIMQKKMQTPTEVLCKGFPEELATFITYSKNLKFEQKPDYSYLRGLLASARKKNGIQMDYIYDWCQNKNNITVNKKDSIKKSDSKNKQVKDKNNSSNVDNRGNSSKKDPHLKK